MKFRFINTGSNSAAMNMAIDEVLLHSQLPVLRFYRWNPAALTIGRFQKMSTVNQSVCNELNIDIIRRLTGGKAVLHEKELTYSFIIDESEMPKDIVQSYLKISTPIVRALNKLNIPAQMTEVLDEKPSSPNCFLEPSWYEITVNAKKVVGSAQVRTNGRLLQHGSLLLGMDYNKLGRIFEQEPDKLKERISHLDLEYELLSQQLLKEFRLGLNIEFIESTLTSKELDRAKDLAENKYSNKEWKFKH